LETNPEALPQAPLIDAYDNSEERVSEKEVHGLKDIYNLLRLAAIEIVNEEDDAVNGVAEFVQSFGILRRLDLPGRKLFGVSEDVAEGLKVATGNAHEAELVTVVDRLGTAFNEVAELAFGAEFVERDCQLLFAGKSAIKGGLGRGGVGIRRGEGAF
jgi:hypothetical protein